ncbi:hypothetical protein ABZ353_27900 [Streptomyces niveus]|uniref:hypothetical protein n=1 Tax=Streptomyces niveus TaxID=193462 RepID=UPI0033FFADCF
MNNDHDPLLSQRAAIIFVFALLIGLAAGALTLYAGGAPATAVLLAGGAFAGGAAFFHSTIA